MSSDNLNGGNPFRAILDVSAALVSSLDLDTVFATTATAVGAAMMVWGVEIETYDSAAQTLTCRACWFADNSAVGHARPETTVLIDRPGMTGVLLSRDVRESHADDSHLITTERQWLADRDLKTMLSAPLAVGDEIIGVLTLLERRFVRRFTSIERDLFRQLSETASVGIHNARLYETVDRQKRHLGSLLDASKALSSSLDLDTVLTLLAERATEALDVPECDIFEYDRVAETMTWRATFPPTDVFEGELDGVGTCYALDAYPGDPDSVLKGELLIESISDADLHPNTRRGFIEYGEKTCLTLPLTFAGEVLGTLELIETRYERRFNDDEIDLATALSEQAAVALHNATMYRRQEDGMRRLASLLDINRALASRLDARDVFSTITRESAGAFGAPRAIIYEYDATNDTLTERNVFQKAYVEGYDDTDVAEPLDATPGNREILFSDRPVVEQASDPLVHPETRAEMHHYGEHSALNVPLAFDGEPLGILMLIWTGEERRFTDDECDFAMGVGEQAAIALRNARLAVAPQPTGSR